MGSKIELGGYTGELQERRELIDGPIVLSQSVEKRWLLQVFDREEASLIEEVCRLFESIGLKPLQEDGFVFVIGNGDVNKVGLEETQYFLSENIDVNR